MSELQELKRRAAQMGASIEDCKVADDAIALAESQASELAAMRAALEECVKYIDGFVSFDHDPETICACDECEEKRREVAAPYRALLKQEPKR